MTETDWFEDVLGDMDATAGEDNAVEWKEKEGDVLRGVFKYAKQVDTKYGLTYLAFIENKDKDGELTKVWCSRSMLQREMLEMSPAKGSLIVIRYQGKQKAKKEGGNDWHKYEVMAQESDYAYWQSVDRRGVQKDRPPTPEFGPEESPF